MHSEANELIQFGKEKDYTFRDEYRLCLLGCARRSSSPDPPRLPKDKQGLGRTQHHRRRRYLPIKLLKVLRFELRMN